MLLVITIVSTPRSQCFQRHGDYHGSMANTFGSFLHESLRRCGLGVREYSRIIFGHNRGHSFVSRVLRDMQAPPMGSLDVWAIPLKLTEAERHKFDFLASVANSPPLVKKWFEKHDIDNDE